MVLVVLLDVLADVVLVVLLDVLAGVVLVVLLDVLTDVVLVALLDVLADVADRPPIQHRAHLQRVLLVPFQALGPTIGGNE